MTKTRTNKNFFYFLVNLILWISLYVLTIKVFDLPFNFVYGMLLIASSIVIDYIFAIFNIRNFIRLILSLAGVLFLFVTAYVISQLISGAGNHNFFDILVFYAFRDSSFALIFIACYYILDNVSILDLSLARYIIATLLFVIYAVRLFHYSGDIGDTFFVNYFYYSLNVALVLLLILLRHIIFHCLYFSDSFNIRDFVLLILIFIPIFIFLFTFTLPDHIDKKNVSGGMFSSDLFSFDFSNYVELKDKIEIADKRVLILEIENLSKDIMDGVYLKRFALEQYIGNGSYKVAEKNVDPNSPPNSVNNYIWQSKNNFLDFNQIQTLYLLNINYGTLLGSEMIKRIVPKKITGWKNSPYKQIYSVEVKTLEDTDYIFALTCKGQSKFIQELSFNRLEMLLDWGDHRENARICELAHQITDQYDSFANKVYAVQDYLRENYMYSLQPGSPTNRNESQLNYFLFDIKKGYCTYFAFAMVTMLRSIGIISRVAVGFAPDDENRTLNYYDVRSPHAHVWVEVYFDDIGWVTFDPTSSTLAPDASYIGVPSQEDDRNNLIESIISNKDNLTDITEMMVDTNFSIDQLNGDFRQRFRLSGLIILGILAVAFVIWVVCYFLRVEMSLFFIKDIRRKTQLYYKLLLRKLTKHKLSPNTNEGVSVFADRIEREHGIVGLSELTRLYLMAEYSARYDSENYAEFVKLYKEIMKNIKSKR